MRILIFCASALMFAGCGQPDENKNDNFSLNDESSRAVSEAEITKAGCSFIEVDYLTKWQCAKPNNVLEFYNQKLSLYKYERSATKWLISKNPTASNGQIANKPTYDAVTRKSFVAHTQVRNLERKNLFDIAGFANLRKAKLPDPDKQTNGLQLLLRISLSTGVTASVTKNSIKVDFRESDENTNSLILEELKDFDVVSEFDKTVVRMLKEKL